MERSFSESYKQAGVDITAGYKAVELMKKHIARTVTAGAASDIGGFGGLFELDLTGMTRPVLVSGTDGVGTKLKYAFMLQKHDTIGIDCVAMCVNDQERAGAHRVHRCGRGGRLRAGGSGAHRRRDRGDAGLLSRGRI